jgi:hypothetical protein
MGTFLVGFAPESMDFAAGEEAQTAGATAAETGDFTTFSPSELVTIKPNMSAVIDVLATDFSCEQTLYYTLANDKSKSGRPEMAVNLTNTLPYGLQRGPCNIYGLGEGDQSFQGQAIMPDIKTSESRMLTHGIDTSVQITRRGGIINEHFSSLKIQKGVLVTERTKQVTTVYEVRSANKKKQSLIIDHDLTLKGTKAKVESSIQPKADTANGNRYVLDTKPGSTTELKITESEIVSSKVNFIAPGDFSWLSSNIIATEHESASQVKGIDEVLKVRESIGKQEAKIKALEAEAKTLETHQNEIRKNITAYGDNNDHANNAKNQLSTNDKRLQEVRTKLLPEAIKEQEKLQEQFQGAMKNVTLAWQEKKG